MAIASAKLSKMTIQVYEDSARSRRTGALTVMFNPASLSMSFSNVFPEKETINTEAQSASYARRSPARMSLSLVFDGTGLGDGGGAGSVSRRIQEFLDSTVHMNGSTHEPSYLRVQWGDGLVQSFDCRLQSVDINHKLFDKSGAPLRAELSTSFLEDLEDQKRTRLEGKSSPDLTHTRIVRSGDTLPLLCKEIYGSAAHYLRVARANDLSDFRRLVPGTEIVFPPLSK